MSDTALVVFGTIITILLIGGIVFSLLEFKRMHDNPKLENMSDRQPAKRFQAVAPSQSLKR